MSPTRFALPCARPALQTCAQRPLLTSRRLLVTAPVIAGLLVAGAASASSAHAVRPGSLPAAATTATLTAAAGNAGVVPASASQLAAARSGTAGGASVTGHRLAAAPSSTTPAPTSNPGGTLTQVSTKPADSAPAPTAAGMTQTIGVDATGTAAPAGATASAPGPSARIGYVGAPARGSSPAPMPAPAPVAAPAASAADQVLTMLNQQRAANGIGAVSMDGRLVASAHAHNLTMSAANTMSHQLPGEASFSARITAAGYTWRAAAENIGWTTDATANGALSLQLAMYNEVAPNDGHRRNILNGGLANVGVDVYIDGSGKLWITVDFGTPR